MFALVLAVAVAAPAPAPPDGTYTYVEVEGGKTAAKYSVTVKRAGSQIDVKSTLQPDEHFSAPGVRPYVDSQAALDAGTLNLVSYQEMESIGCSAIPYAFTVNGSQAQWGQTKVTFPGIEHFVVDDRQAVPFFLPAEIAVWSDDRAVSILPERGVGHVIEPYPMAGQPARPVAVPASDLYIAMHALGSKTSSTGLWYDPQTLVVDEVDTSTGHWLRRDRP